MSDPFIVSRRRAAMFLAGTLAASGSSAAVLSADAASAATLSPTRADDHRRIAALLREVRRAPGLRSRARAFERCKAAFAAHECCPAPQAAVPRGTAAVTTRSTLYVFADPAQALARVIVRELDAMPPADDQWLKRFGDLESAYALHAAAYE